MNHPIDQLFLRAGRPALPAQPTSNCPSDEAFADYLGALLPAREREVLETHALACSPCHELLRMVVDVAAGIPQLVREAAPAPMREPTHQLRTEPVTLRIVGRLAQHGLELLNHVELTFRTLMDGPMMPALGTLRRASDRDTPACSEWVCVRGPGQGLDELELQVQPNGTARLLVRCEKLPELRPQEITSILLDVDGAAREKRPFSGEPITFAPLGRGRYRVRLVARAPGAAPRQLAEATIDLAN